MSRIAIMQPYFLPYAGYFRLLVDVDAFVVGDVQQFPRRGWVHRNRLYDDEGNFGWLTLPIHPKPLGTAIGDIAYAEGAQRTLERNMARFAACRRPNAATAPILDALRLLGGRPTDLFVDLIRHVARTLDFRVPIYLQSELGVPAGTPPHQQICDICEKLNAKEYINAPGGHALYDPADFSHRGVRLLFLSAYRGDNASILQRLADCPADLLRREIFDNLIIEGP